MTREQVAELTKLVIGALHSVEIDEPEEVEHEGYKAIEVVVRRKDLKRWWSVGIRKDQSTESAAAAIAKAFAEAVQAQ